jgi:hypothetical protein
VQRAGRISISWKSASTVASCSARMIIRRIWLGNDVTQALLRNKASFGGNDEKHHPETTQNVPFLLSDSTGLLVIQAELAGLKCRNILNPSRGRRYQNIDTASYVLPPSPTTRSSVDLIAKTNSGAESEKGSIHSY